MNSRSKKYYENRKAQNGDKKGSVNESGYNEQNTTTQFKESPAPSKNQDRPKKDSRAAQDTGGDNNSGKGSDSN